MEERPRKLAVILHADVVDSTMLVQKSESLAHDRIRSVFSRFSATIEAYNGHPLELRGDALVAEFNRASDAVEASLAFQAENTQFNSTLKDDIQPTLRIGISLGEVVVADNTITGEGIVLAQRLEQLASPGSVCIQGAVHEAVPGRLPFDYESLGEQELKGFSEPVRAYAVSLKSGEAVPLPEVDSRSDKTWPAQLKDRRMVVGAIVLLTIVGGGLTWFQPWKPEEEPASIERTVLPLPSKPSIAVLAFDNLSGDPKQEYLSDAISEAIITGLSRFPELFVIARQSSFSYKNQSVKVQQVAEELGVHYILEGSVQRSGERIRVTAQLIDGSTGHHYWAEQYDRQWKDIFSLQDDITQNIVANIGSFEGAIADATRELIRRKAPADLKAYDHLLLGVASFFLVTKEDNAKARALFKKAVALDPAYSLGHSWIAWTHIVDFNFGFSEDPASAARLALESARKAIELDNAEPLAHWALAGILARTGKQPQIALAEYERALALNPNNADLMAQYGWSLPNLGRAEEAVELIEKAMRLNPIHPDWYRQSLMFSLYNARRYREVIAVADTMKVRHLRTFLVLAGSHAYLDQLDGARSSAAKALEIQPDFSLSAWRQRQKFVRPADMEHYFEGLRKAGLPE